MVLTPHITKLESILWFCSSGKLHQHWVMVRKAIGHILVQSGIKNIIPMDVNECPINSAPYGFICP